MKNCRFYPNDPADKLSLPVADGTKSGDPVVVGSLVGVAATDKGAGGNVAANATVWLSGVYDLAVGTTTAVAAGGDIYITGAGALTPSDGAGANTLFGHAVEAKGTTAGEIVPIKLAKV